MRTLFHHLLTRTHVNYFASTFNKRAILSLFGALNKFIVIMRQMLYKYKGEKRTQSATVYREFFPKFGKIFNTLYGYIL